MTGTRFSNGQPVGGFQHHIADDRLMPNIRHIIRIAEMMSNKKFDYTLDYSALDLRQQPELYYTGIGEQGVLLVEPYKSEILPFWHFKTPVIARASAEKIYQLFLGYARQKDFVGMDMARKFLQMGYTRSRRYANHRSGKKYAGPVPDDKKGQSGSHGRPTLPPDPDPEKALSADTFYSFWMQAKQHSLYKKMMKEHRQLIIDNG